MSVRRPQKSWAESSDEEDNGVEEVKKFEELTRGRALNWANSSDESEDIADEDSDDEDSTSSEEDEADEGNIQPEQPMDLPVQGSVDGGPKPLEQMSKKERKALKEKELVDLEDLLCEFGVTLEPPKPEEMDDIKMENFSKDVEIKDENSIVREGASQRGKVKRKRKKETRLPMQGNEIKRKDEDANGGDAIVAQPVTAVLKSKLITGKKKPTKASVASAAAKTAGSVDARKKKQDKKEKKKHYNQNPPNKN